MPDAYQQLRWRRLVFLPRLLRSAPDSLLHVLDASVAQTMSFADTIRADLEWMGQHCYRVSVMESPPGDLYQWLKFCATPSWKSLLRNAYLHDNRLYLDGLAHECMLLDITKLRKKVGLGSLDFSIFESAHSDETASAIVDVIP